jgi:hypothetical protein
LFTNEEPPLPSTLKIPEVHSYYRSGQNTYNNLVAIEFGLLSFLFVILSYINLSMSVCALLLWGLSIPITFFLIKWHTERQEFEKVMDYIRFVEPDFNPAVVKEIVQKFFVKGSLEKQEIIEGLNYDATLLSRLADIYILYQTRRNNALVKGEIEEINDL